jgi:hypothetical protein
MDRSLEKEHFSSCFLFVRPGDDPTERRGSSRIRLWDGGCFGPNAFRLFLQKLYHFQMTVFRCTCNGVQMVSTSANKYVHDLQRISCGTNGYVRGRHEWRVSIRTLPQIRRSARSERLLVINRRSLFCCFF